MATPRTKKKPAEQTAKRTANASSKKSASRKKSANGEKSAKRKSARNAGVSKKKAAPVPALLKRLRSVVARRKNLREQAMFGGYCFLYNGNMAFGVTGKEELMVRVGPDAYEALLEEPHAREMKFTGRAMKGILFIDAPGIQTKAQLQTWVERGIKFCKTLPPK